MTYTPHTLVAFGGSWYTDTGASELSGEIWACNIRTSNDPTTIVPCQSDDLVATAEKIAGNLSTIYGDTDNNFSQYSTLDWVKVNNIDANGRYASDEYDNTYDLDPVVQGGAQNACSPQNCVAISWTTDQLRGLAHTGRIYPPNPSWALVGAGLISTTSAEHIVTVGQGILTALVGDTSEFRLYGIVASKIGNPGPAYHITGVRVGNRVDTQRRRLNGLTETYSTGVWPTT